MDSDGPESGTDGGRSADVDLGSLEADGTSTERGRRRRVLRWIAPVCLVLAGAAMWTWWTQLRVEHVPVSLALPTAARLTATGPGQTVYRIDATRSSVTYEVDEILAGQTNVAKGTTSGIAGDILIDEANPAASKVGEIVVNVQQLTSDQQIRDDRLRHEFLASRQYPLAYLNIDRITGLPATIEADRSYDLTLGGTLTVKDIDKPVELTGTARRTAADELDIQLTTTVHLADWSIGPISLGPLVSTGDTAKLTFTAVAINADEDLPYNVIEASTDGTTSAAVGTGPSFDREVRPILEQQCASCHNPGQAGSAIWSLDTAGDAARVAPGLGLVTGSGYMPPWPASDVGIPLKHERKLSDAEIKTIADWAAAGGPLDVDPTSKVVAQPDNTESLYEIREDQRLTYDAPYQGSTENVNDYRCFVLDPKFTETTFITGFEFQPDQLPVTHHVLGFRVDGSERAAVDQLDAASDGTGWECYAGMSGPGGTQSPDGGTKGSQLIMGWVPGQRPNKLPEGSGIKMEPGSFIVVQVHYHFAHSAPADRPSFVIETSTDPSLDEVVTQTYLGPAEIPCRADEQGPMCDRRNVIERLNEEFGPSAGVIADGLALLCRKNVADFPIPGPDGIATSTCDQRIRRDGELIGVLGHEHEIGRTFRMTLNPGTPDEKILLDIPNWDFKWQMVYAPEEPIEVKRGDVLRIECSWDRDLIKSSEPVYVTWAEGTEDEMCYSAVTTRLRK